MKKKAINEKRRAVGQQAGNGLKEETRMSATEVLKELTEEAE